MGTVAAVIGAMAARMVSYVYTNELRRTVSAMRNFVVAVQELQDGMIIDDELYWHYTHKIKPLPLLSISMLAHMEKLLDEGDYNGLITYVDGVCIKQVRQDAKTQKLGEKQALLSRIWHGVAADWRTLCLPAQWLKYRLMTLYNRPLPKSPPTATQNDENEEPQQA